MAGWEETAGLTEGRVEGAPECARMKARAIAPAATTPTPRGIITRKGVRVLTCGC